MSGYFKIGVDEWNITQRALEAGMRMGQRAVFWETVAYVSFALNLALILATIIVFAA